MRTTAPRWALLAMPLFRDLPKAARLYIVAILALAPAALAAVVWAIEPPPLDTTLLCLALVLGPLANLFEVFAPGNYSLQPNLVFFFWGAVLLPPWTIGLLAIACFLPGAIVHRFRWYMLGFNVANYALCGLAANLTAGDAGLAVSSGIGLSALTALVAAATLFLTLNYGLIAVAVSLSRGRPIRLVGRELAKGLPLDSALAMTGACLAVLWRVGPAFVVLVAGPIVLAYRALWVPLLKHKSRTDPKTGLYNSEHFEAELAGALKAAKRDAKDLSVGMFDLDHLRAVNNRFGHLAGDELIRGIADLLVEYAPDDAVAARFGGEEFCLILPGMAPPAARELAERIRAATQLMTVRSADGGSLGVTVSIGIAGYPDHGETPEELLQTADAALYDAKLGGRNRIRVALPPDAAVTRGVERRPPAASAQTDEKQLGADLGTLAVGPPSAVRDAIQPKAAPPTPRRVVPWFVGMLVVGAASVATFAASDGVAGSSLTFGLLVASVVALDVARIDIFERAKMSPASMPTLALAFLFGPLGPVAAEGVIAVIRAARRERPIKLSFDFGALSLAGAIAAVTFAVAHNHYGVPMPIAGVLGGLTYYAVNIPLLATIICLTQREPILHVWREQLAWLSPHYLVFGLLGGTFVLTDRALGLYSFVVFGAPLLTLWIAEMQYLKRSRSGVFELRAANQELERANEGLRALLDRNEQLLGRVHHSYLATITSLARTIDAKDPYTGGHTERVAEIVRLLAIELSFNEEELRAIEVGAVIHDIGKIGVPDQILLKQGKLDEAEFAEMRRHPEISSYIIGELDLPTVVKQMVRSHHERYDGSGYPDGLAGEEIPLAARILTVADSLDAMTSDRPYRKAMSPAVARAELEANAGLQFCPKVISALKAAFDRDPGLWASLLARGDTDQDVLQAPADLYAAQYR
jgi:diguanylate cyclase (GGDEF)-like protein